MPPLMHTLLSILLSFYLLFSHQVLNKPPGACINGKTPLHLGVMTKSTGCTWQVSGALPDYACTPGAIDPRVTQENIRSTICVSGYTKKVRPSTYKTNKIKRERIQAYSGEQTLALYELDHQISLELGGCPDCIANLWPEPYNTVLGARDKDKIENYLHEQVCSGKMTLKEAQEKISCDWTEIFARMAL